MFHSTIRRAVQAFITFTLISSAPVLFMFMASSAHSEDYYRWVGEDGVVHYGSLPPKGVEATKIKTYSNPSAKPYTQDTNKNNGGEQSEKAGELQKQRAQECQDEKRRLSTLQSSGTRIRMQQDDGSTKYLSPDEVAKEIQKSRDFINGACK